MRTVFSASLVTALLTASACSSSDEELMDPGKGGNGTATSIVVRSGDDQRIVAGGQLLEPLVVQVKDASGNGVSGVSVSWAVTAGGGSLSGTTSTTNSQGEASVTLRAGSSESDNTVTASASGLTGSPVTFTAVAVTPSAIGITGGNNQTARLSQPLAAELEVRVSAGDGGAVPGAAVTWMVTGGSGSVSASSTTTDSDGRASVGWTLGAAVGGNTADASAGSGVTASFAADGTQPVSVTVNMQGIAFVAPGGGDDITIMLGDTVVWVNQDAVQHTATSNSVPGGGMSFDSGLLSQGQSFTFVPNARGEWVYFCEVHPGIMLDARITVE